MAHQIPKLQGFSSRLAGVFSQSIEAMYQVEIEDVAGAAPTTDDPPTFEWSTNLLPTNVRLVLEIWRYIFQNYFNIQIVCQVYAISRSITSSSRLSNIATL